MAVDIKAVMLQLGEENAKVLIKQVIRPMAEEFIKNSETKVDDIILGFMDQIEAGLLQLADKIAPESV